MQRELDNLQRQLDEARKGHLTRESVQVGIDKINAAHCKALKERDTAASALRVELDKANTRLAELEKEMEAKEISYADGVKALQEERARVKLEMFDLTKHVRAAVSGILGKIAAAISSASSYSRCL